MIISRAERRISYYENDKYDEDSIRAADGGKFDMFLEIADFKS